MMKPMQIVVLNPGSTSTKTAVYLDEREDFSLVVDHPAEELSRFAEITDQLPLRQTAVERALADAGCRLEESAAFAAISTGLLPTPGGVYEVNALMCEHSRQGLGSRHPGNLGPLLADDFARRCGARAFVVDPSSTDELCPEARLTGLLGVVRSSRGHPLNQRAVARRFAREIRRPYEELSLVVVHMGGGISVSAHRQGRMIDTVDSTRGEGRMAPTRTGALPVTDVIRLCFSGKYTEKQLMDKVQRTGGWTELLGTSDSREVESRIAAGDVLARAVYDATAYQIAKDVGAMAATLETAPDAVILTGGLAHSAVFTAKIRARVGFLAPIWIYPGELEMEALATGALSVLRGEKEPQHYTAAGK